MKTNKIDWQNVITIPPQSFRCWNCGHSLASDHGWQAHDSQQGRMVAFVCICHRCFRPTFIEDDGTQVPGVQFGNAVNDVADNAVQALYDESRAATEVGAYTASVLACRKLLMHIAVAKGANPGETFITYVEYLAANHFIPPDAKDWVDHIRQRGNEANHEINTTAKADAEELIVFSEMLLKLIYKFPAAIKRKSATPSGAT